MSKVEKTFSFASWATDHPSDPVPGDRIDVQFDNHHKAIDALSKAVHRLVRADGKLNHDLLTPESLPKELAGEIAAKARQEIERHVQPLVANVTCLQAELEAAQLDLRATLAETKRRAAEASEQLQQVRALQADIDARTRSTVQAMTRAVQAQAQAFEDANWNQLQANTAEDWAKVSTVWAEFMDGNATIPPNILASNSITGDHWSSRWWANRAASAFGMLAWWYLGAYPGIPPSTPYTPTGQPIPPGGMYYDTDDERMFVWSGSEWLPLAQGPAAATTSSLYYPAVEGDTVFPMGVADIFGNTFSFDPAHPEGIHCFVNGVRLTPTYDFTIDIPNSTITLLQPAFRADVVAIDVLTNRSQLAPTGTASTYLLAPIVPDGTAVLFSNLVTAVGAKPINVIHNTEVFVSVDGIQQSPGIDYNVTADDITFTQAPSADSKIFMIWFGPVSLP